MRVADARAAARHWVRWHAAPAPGFLGAFLTGSAAAKDGDEPLPPWSDVDVAVVLAGAAEVPKLGKVRHRGALLDVTYLPEELLADTERVAAMHYLAPSFAGPADRVLLDPTGLLERLRSAIAPTFAEPAAVRLRCADVLDTARARLVALDRTARWHEQVTAWMFSSSLVTVAVQVAAGRMPTVRLRYRAARDVLRAHGRTDLYQHFLELLGCADVERSVVARHLDRLAGVFDEAAAVGRTPFFFSTDISAEARAIAIDGSRVLVEGGEHREAVFWIVATFARCQQILVADAPPERRRAGEQAFGSAVGELLGLHDPDGLQARSAGTRALLPELEESLAAIGGYDR